MGYIDEAHRSSSSQRSPSSLRPIEYEEVGICYSLWEIGYIDEVYQSGSALGRDPWWVVITATSFVGGMWFQLPASAAILL